MSENFTVAKSGHTGHKHYTPYAAISNSQWFIAAQGVGNVTFSVRFLICVVWLLYRDEGATYVLPAG